VRLKRTQDDFRVFEQLDESKLAGGEFAVHRITKKGLTTAEAAETLAKQAGVDMDAIAFAGTKDRNGVCGQYLTVVGGSPVNLKTQQLTIRHIGSHDQAVNAELLGGNSFELTLRDLEGAEMGRIRHNLAQAKEWGMPNYFDDQRFGCLRHGQGFVVRQLLRGDVEGALKSLMCAKSPYGGEEVEKFKAGMAHRWGDWAELTSYCRGRRGASLFEYLKDNPDDFRGALERGISTRERTIHLFAYQSHLWNRVAAMWIRGVIGEGENLGWLPCDDGSLPVYRELEPDQLASLRGETLPLFGEGAKLDGLVERYYRTVFKTERIDADDFLNLDISGFRPKTENRSLLMIPEFLRAAPAERDEMYRSSQKMRLRFTLPRGQYSTLVIKRLAMPTQLGDRFQPCLWISRHRLTFPDDQGRMDAPDQVSFDKNRQRTSGGWKRRDDNGGGRDGGGYRGSRDDGRGSRDNNRGGGGWKSRDGNRSGRGGWKSRDDNRGSRDNNRNSGKEGGWKKSSDDSSGKSPWDNAKRRNNSDDGDDS